MAGCILCRSEALWVVILTRFRVLGLRVQGLVTRQAFGFVDMVLELFEGLKF